MAQQPPPGKRDPRDQQKERGPGSGQARPAERDGAGGLQPAKRGQPGGPPRSRTIPDGSGPHRVPTAPGVRAPTQPGARTLSGQMPRNSSTGIPAIDLGNTRNAQEFQKHIHNSVFSARPTFEGIPATRFPPGEEEPTEIGHFFDGNTPAKDTTAREGWKAINAPVQSREGRRSANVYQLVLDQFAVGVNPRYEPDAPDKPRGHIFVWDVTRAMNVEIPHFMGARELSLPQTCLWIRDQGPLRGWHMVDLYRALEAVNAGQPVVVMPKDVKINLIGMMRPGDLTPDNRPYLSAAARKRGNGLTVQEAFGVFAVQYFFHA